MEQVIFKYAVFAIITVVAALFLPHLADNIAEQTDLGRTLVVSLFLAVSTSLPEIAVSVAAARMNSPDLAVGNILGSNIFNVFILFLDDIFYTKRHLLEVTSDCNLISVFSAIIMSAIVIISITFSIQQKKKYLLDWYICLISLCYKN